MKFPLISEYIESIKMAEYNFATLSNFRPVLNDKGEPIMSSGNFAVVFKMIDQQSNRYFAVKCFLRDQDGRDSAYRMISEELKKHESIFLVEINYYEKELFVDSVAAESKDYPILVMEWVDGCSLTEYLRENAANKYRKSVICYEFSLLANWLLGMPFAHGDLKPDNIVITEDARIVLVDYDGMYVPAMQNLQAREYGSIDYQIPDRQYFPFGKDIDDLALVSIQMSLLLLTHNSEKVNQYVNEDGLLFTHNDYINFSRINEIVDKSEDLDVRTMLSCLWLILCHKISLSNVPNTFNIKSPIDLVPYRLTNEDNVFYSKKEQRILNNVSFWKIEPIDKYFTKSPNFIAVKRCKSKHILFEKKEHYYYRYAYITKKEDIMDIKWYEMIHTFNENFDYLKIKSWLGYGIIDSSNNIIVEPNNKTINHFFKGTEIFFIIERECDDYIIYNPRTGEKSETFKYISALYKFPDYLEMKKENENFLYKISSSEIFLLPDEMIGISDINKNKLLINIKGDIHAIYDIALSKYVSKKCYSTINWGKTSFKENYFLCKDTKTNLPVLLAVDGTEYTLDVTNYDKIDQNGKYVIVIKEYKDHFNYFLLEYGKLTLKESIPYNYFYDSVYGYIDEDGVRFESSSNQGVSRIIKKIDFKGNDIQEQRQSNTKKHTVNLYADIKNELEKKYLNDNYIDDYSKLTVDELSRWGSAEFQFWVEPNRFLSEIRGYQDADEYSYDFTVGYVDNSNIYFSSDLLVLDD